jgi:hypothetical protein
LILLSILSLGATSESPCVVESVSGSTMTREVLGLYEPVYLLSSGVRVTGLVDTGAEISSIDMNLAQQLKITTPIRRRIYVRTAHGTQQRDIVMLRIKVRDQVLQREFTLSNRRDMKEKILLGRNVLKGFLIDLNR